MLAKTVGTGSGNVSTQTQTRSRFQGQGCTRRIAQGSNGGPACCSLRGPFPQIYAWKKGLVEAAPRVFADHLGPSDELSERELAELYEQQLGRMMMERDFLLRPGAASPLTSSSTITSGCTRPWVTAPRTRSSRKRCSLPSFGAGEKPLVLIARQWHHEALNPGRILYLKFGRSLSQ